MNNQYLYTDFLQAIENEIDCFLDEEWPERLEEDLLEWTEEHGWSNHSILEFIKYFRIQILEAETRAELQEQDEDEDA